MAKHEKSNYYFDSFAKGIDYTNQAASQLKKCLDNYGALNMESQLEEMHTIEHTADGIKHEMTKQLVKEFLPPIEREDILELSVIIDDVTDAIEDVLRGMYMYNISQPRPEAKQFAQLIAQCCAGLTDIARELPNFRKSSHLLAKIIEINGLEEDGDRLYTSAMRRLYTEEKDAVTILAWTTVFDRLERCCDCCEEVADKVEQVVMKNA